MFDAADRFLQQTIDRTLKDRYAVTSDELERLTDAAFRTIAREGRTNVPVREILRDAGLSTQAFYRYFKSKSELMVIVVARGASVLATYLNRRVDRAGDPASQVAAWIDGVLRQASTPTTSERTLPFILEHERLASEHQKEVLEIEDLLMEPLVRAIEAGIAAGMFTSPSPPADARVIHDVAFAQLRRSLHAHRPASPDEHTTIVGCVSRLLTSQSGQFGSS